MIEQYTRALSRSVFLREYGSDQQVWADTFTGLYHIPPGDFPAPKTVLDLGANIGLTAAHYQALWPEAEIVAVEMDTDCCALAVKNAPEVKVVNYAVSAEGGWGGYNPTLRAEAFAFQQSSGYGDVPDMFEPVMSHKLPSIIRGEFGGHVDFVKMDVEGEEWALFAHPAWVPMVDTLIVELHHGDMTSVDMVNHAVELLLAAGFKDAAWTGHHPQAVIAHR